MHIKKSKEKEAEIRNRLQATTTVLEMVLKGEKPPQKIVKMALKDLEKLLKVIKKQL